MADTLFDPLREEEYQVAEAEEARRREQDDLAKHAEQRSVEREVVIERESILAEELAFALNPQRRGLSERALEALEDHVLALRDEGREPAPEIVVCLDGFRGKGQWPAE